MSASGPAGEAPPEDPGLLEDNTFVDHGASGFVDAAEDPQSTFALDVDTGSFTVARTLLEQGVRPPAASIRVEEWVNSFAYGDAARRRRRPRPSRRRPGPPAAWTTAPSWSGSP